MLDIKKLLTKMMTNFLPKANIAHGYESVGTVNASSYKDVTINHNLGTNQVHVVATMFSSGTAVNIGNTTITVHDVSTNTAQVRVFNNRSTTLSPALEWLAIKV